MANHVSHEYEEPVLVGCHTFRTCAITAPLPWISVDSACSVVLISDFKEESGKTTDQDLAHWTGLMDVLFKSAFRCPS